VPPLSDGVPGQLTCPHCAGILVESDNYQPGHVLDPFGGTGTTGAVAHLHGRDATLIDIDERNANMYPARLDECRRTLFGVKPELPGQEALFG
jgi:tRNA G10  N-methylase Trm11